MKAEKTSILIVDDDRAHRTMLRVNLKAEGYNTAELEDGDLVLPFLSENDIDLILLDLKMKRMDGMATLSTLLQSGFRVPIVVITAFSSVESAVKAMKKGAFDYITKPVDIDELNILIRRALSYQQLSAENSALRNRINEEYSFANIIGNSESMQELFATLRLVAPSDATVLITGETGTGKELIANAIHENSQRKSKAFIKLNCAALHENLLESELFGHEVGAFTGANKQRKGRFELADGGTLFLDEIGDMTLPTQAKILRVLQEGEFERLGGTQTIRVDVRLLAATHKDLATMIKEGSFRQDLYFRLSVVPVALPALRQRNIDIHDLANHFLNKFAKKNRKDIRGFHQETLQLLMQYDWPGNIRELENSIERAVILCQGERILPHELPSQLLPESYKHEPEISTRSLTLREIEREAIRNALESTGYNKSQTAKKLGVARQTLLNKIKEYGLS